MGKAANRKLVKRATWPLERLHDLKTWASIKPRITALKSIMGTK